MNNDNVFNIDELVKLLKEYNLDKRELRQALRPAAIFIYGQIKNEVGRGWGIRTGRLSREGVKMGVSNKDEARGGAAYRIYFSKKSGPRGTPEYMADTFKARWLEGGTKPHYTAKGATIKKAKKGRLILNSHQRKLMHPGFAGRPIIERLVTKERGEVVEITRRNITQKLIKKGATDGNS
nr:MAG: virion morphogenesis family protein [Bacteriophage sp.]